jgi:[1-hydroxy-2-(trimethylamino)ethyl]phosphonate dioxygenase
MTSRPADRLVEEIVDLYARKGGASYGEGVSLTEHGLQAAQLAEQEGQGAPMIVAALLHDIGHLLHDFPEDIADQGIDSQHESLASAWLSQYFPKEVSEPVRLHVAAKRFLCATVPGYFADLSPASVQSLELQGGQMSADESKAFMAEPFMGPALRLRRWDDLAKVAGLKTPDFAHYKPAIAAVLEQDPISWIQTDR